jgi:NADH-quinone oxidoreductase subunit E
MFSLATEEKLDVLLHRFPERRSALLPALHLAQKEVGYISPEVVAYLAERFELSTAQVYETVTFYNMFFTKPVGKCVFQVCTNVSCSLRGSEELLKLLKEHLGIEVGQTTADGKFTLLEVECLASCGTAPVVQINEDYVENLNAQKLQEIVDKLKLQT